MSMSGRTISALKKSGITLPHKKPIGELLRLPNIGIGAVTEIAERYYHGMSHLKDDEPWPELWDRPAPVIQRCSHRVKVTERCSKCIADLQARSA